MEDIRRILEDSSGGKQRRRAQEQPTGCGIAKTPGSGSGVLSDDSLDRPNQPIHSITHQVAVPLNSSFSDKLFVFVFKYCTHSLCHVFLVSARVSTQKKKTPRGTHDITQFLHISLCATELPAPPQRPRRAANSTSLIGHL